MVINLFFVCILAVTVEGYISGDYIGCYKDLTGHAMDGLQKFNIVINTIQSCIDTCESYPFAGLRDGNECYCGRSYHTDGKASEGECNKPCSGNSEEICGGVSISVYRTNRYIGCYNDASDRALDGYKEVGIAYNTVARCAETCRVQNFKYAAPQFGTECYCGNSYNKHGEANEEDCNEQCPGDPKQNCGAPWKLSVYKTSEYAENYIGCYHDEVDRAMGPYNYSSSYANTVSSCVVHCKSKRFQYAGLQARKYCHCGNTYMKHGKASEDDCGLTCSGRYDEICGGYWRLSVYFTGYYEAGYVGCYTDSSDRAMTGHSDTSVADNSVESCIKKCVTLHFPYAGVEDANQCHCGNSYDKHGKAHEEQCDMLCTGNGNQMCGGSYKLSVYKTGASPGTGTRARRASPGTGTLGETTTPHEWCLDEYPVLDGLLCYKECSSGYAHEGGGPVCWAVCPSETTDIGALCIKHTYGRGVGKPLSTCGSDTEQGGLLCYPPCEPNYDPVGPLCWERCKDGYDDRGVFCRRNVHIYNRDTGNCPWYDKCGLCNGHWYNVCGQRRDCGGSCNAGYKDDGCTCRRDIHIYLKTIYGRGTGSVMGCEADQEEDSGLCYPQCKSKYYGVGPVCWARCGGETIDTGAQCQKKSYGRGVGKPVTCLTTPTIADFVNYTGLLNLFKNANGFENLQAAGCAKLYVQLKFWVTLVESFHNCVKHGNWQTISLSYSLGGAALLQYVGELGLAVDTYTKKGLCYVGYCWGFKSDVSIGGDANIGWWKSLGDIPGESRAFEIGLDFPGTENGATLVMIVNTYYQLVGTQFAFGVGFGFAPAEFGFTRCNTPQEQTLDINI